ncbi:hypothetical protein [Massilia sp. DWR3-1-1]|uniref:hypothetical protein n=1 Tax=Massilia sp. DWR3-1-1 TaxID=2804559 RepID=UPI003CEB2FAB
MNDLSKLSLSELHKLDSELAEAIKTRQYLDISKAREQILYIAQSAGLSVKEILSDKASNRAATGL